MAIHLGRALQRGSCGLPSRPLAGRMGDPRLPAPGRLALLRVEIAAFHVIRHCFNGELLVSVALIRNRIFVGTAASFRRSRP